MDRCLLIGNMWSVGGPVYLKGYNYRNEGKGWVRLRDQFK